MNTFFNGFTKGVQLGILNNLFGGCYCSNFGYGFNSFYPMNFNMWGGNSCFGYGFPLMFNSYAFPTYSYSFPRYDFGDLTTKPQPNSKIQDFENEPIYKPGELATEDYLRKTTEVTDWKDSPLLKFDVKNFSIISTKTETSASEIKATEPRSAVVSSTLETDAPVTRKRKYSYSVNSVTPDKQKEPRFEKYLECILAREGGYADSKYDRGGKTNYGITHKTYDAYRKKKGLPKRDVRQITMEEVRDIYYNEYYLASGANKIADPKMGLYVFDVAVNSGPGTAKRFYKESGGDLKAFEKIRENFYRSIVEKDNRKSKAEGKEPTQWRNLEGWLNRIKEVRNYAMNELSGLDTLA